MKSGLTDDDTFENAILILSKQMVNAERELMALRAAVTVLKSYVATQMNPADPKEFLTFLRRIEQKLLDADPNTLKREEASEVIDVLKNYHPKPDDPDA